MNCKWLPAGPNPSLYCKQPRPHVTPHVQETWCAGGTRVPGGDTDSPDPKATPRAPFCQHKPRCPYGAQAGTHLEEGDDEGTQWEVGGLLELGVELLNGERGVLRGQPGLSPRPPLTPTGMLCCFSPIFSPFLLLCWLCHSQGKTTMEGKTTPKALPAARTQPCTVPCRSQEMLKIHPPFFPDLGQSSTNRTLFFSPV